MSFLPSPKLLAEWHPHKQTYLALPWHEDLWQELLTQVQKEFFYFCQQILNHEAVCLLIPNTKAQKFAQLHLGEHPRLSYCLLPYGDIWLRDTAPLFAQDTAFKSNKPSDKQAALLGLCFQFNGWAKKYQLADDEELALRLCQAQNIKAIKLPFVFEGGGLDHNGEGCLLTTVSCLLHPQRNPGLQKDTAEKLLQQHLGIQQVIWLEEGLLNDHTDGHIDTLARFIDSQQVVCMRPQKDCPNQGVLQSISQTLKASKNSFGQPFQIHHLPSPGNISDGKGKILPASYCNFYLCNQQVLLPTYDSPYDEEALSMLQTLFPKRRVIGCPAKHLLEGGGAWHCISQQEPLL